MLNQVLAIASFRKQRGLTTVEYAVAGGLIAAVVIGAFFALGGNVAAVIDFITGEVQVPGG